MCGINGALVFDESDFKITSEYLIKMRDMQEHRGPDGAGIWISNNRRVGLGHRRLSIIDLSKKCKQPMSNENAKIQLTFNGEIYNHSELRKELEETGKYHWKTDHSDTEVIIHAYEEWGKDCIQKFRGIFAFALWDSQLNELWLVRDRLGVKPLYYSLDNNRIVFASEIKAILEDPNQERNINEEGVFNYLTFLFVPAPQTLFKGIYKLPVATWMTVSLDGSVKEERYWDSIEDIKEMSRESEGNIAGKLLSELRDSINLRKVSDVPVGVFLSGGIDSSTNAALFSEGQEEPLNSFSIAYDNNYKSAESELNYAKRVAKDVGAKYHDQSLNQDDLIRFLPKMVFLQDEPIADPVCVPVYYVSKLARGNNVIVCQVGEGADELFFGYESWKKRLRVQKLANLPIPIFIKKLIVFGLNVIGKDKGWEYEYLRRDSEKKPIFWGGSGAYTEVQKRRILSSRMRKKFKGASSWSALTKIRERFLKKCDSKDIYRWMTYLDLNARLPDLLLMRVDKMAMGVSLEGRVPFLDHKFVEFAMNIPNKYKIKGGNLKNILKKSVRNIIPDEIIDRKKQGFAAPVLEWLSSDLGEIIDSEVDYFCLKTDLFDKDQISLLLKEKNSYKSWQLLNLALWWRTFIEQGITVKNIEFIKHINSTET